MEKGYNEKMIRKQILRAREHSRKDRLEREKTETFETKLTFNIIGNGKSLKDYLVRAALPKTNETRRCEPCTKKTCLVCNSVRTTTTFTTEACGEIFKTQSGPSNCNSKKVLYLLKCKVYGEAPYVGKAKTKFRYRFNNNKRKDRAFRKGNRKIHQKCFHDHYCLDGHLGIDDWDFTLRAMCETQAPKRDRNLLAVPT